eukprot:gnl/TRDRNA2_/TRDRNA2_187018_c0_seq1.p1 gnl/TRDRNA2_/TRDRNA2_187018_c0~~gnl/TRDRNA2_/TRDRNA2_187018_c0_seq1.p1  ORF type:complete len:396 (+),score=66.94 gnl/TRDRNA2_/TRDRNA2_187018_c0_seq1:143-1330(+)
MLRVVKLQAVISLGVHVSFMQTMPTEQRPASAAAAVSEAGKHLMRRDVERPLQPLHDTHNHRTTQAVKSHMQSFVIGSLGAVDKPEASLLTEAVPMHNGAVRRTVHASRHQAQGEASLILASTIESDGIDQQEKVAQAPTQAPATVAPQAPTTAAPVVTATTPAAAGASATVTTAPPAQGANATATNTPAPAPPPEASGGGGGVIIGIVVVIVIAGLIGGAFWWRKRNAKPRAGAGRLNEVPKDESDSQLWRSSKARQTYRKSVLAASGNADTASEDEPKAAPTPAAAAAPAAAPAPARSASATAKTSADPGAGAAPGGGGGGYRSRRGGGTQANSDERTSATSTASAPAAAPSQDAATVSSGPEKTGGTSYRESRKQKAAAANNAAAVDDTLSV